MSSRRDKRRRRIRDGSAARALGVERALKGLREGDSRDLYFGLALCALAYLQRTRPRKRLIHRQAAPAGAAIVIHHRKTASPRLAIVMPPNRRRRRVRAS